MNVIKKQTLYSTLFSYVGVIVGTITQVYLFPNYLEPNQKGLLDLLLAWTYIISQVGNLGFNAAGTKFFPYFRDADRKHNGYLFLGFTLSLIGVILTIIILFIFKDIFFLKKDGQPDLLYYNTFLLIPLSISLILFNVLDNYARSLYDSVFGTFLSQLLLRLLQMSSIILKALGLIDFDTFIIIWVIGFSLPTLLMLYRAIQLTNFSVKPDFRIFKEDSFLTKEFIQFSAFAMFSGLSGLIIQHLDKLMVHDYLGLDLTAVYSNALFFNSVMGMSYVALIKTSAPIVINAMKEEDYGKVATIYTKSSITQLIFGCLLYIGVWASIDRFFEFLPPIYAQGRNVILLIGFGKLFDLATGINSLILSYSKYYRLDTVLLISFILILYLLNTYLIPNYLMNGAAIAATIAVFYFNTIRSYIVWKKFRMHPFSWDTLKIIGWAIVVLLASKLIPSIEGNRWLTLLDIIIRSIFIAIFFVGGIYLMRVSLEINQVIDKAMRVIGIR